MERIAYEDFSAVDMRVGRVIRAEVFPEARTPAYKLWIDFGELGVRKSSARITDLYDTQGLVGRQVVAVVNFPPRQIASFMSEVLVLGVDAGEGGGGGLILLAPEREAPLGARVY